jgi:hypothetical protein
VAVKNLNEEKIQNIVKTLSNDWAQKYQAANKRGPSAAESLLVNPSAGLSFLLENGFARAGGEQAGYGTFAVQALKEVEKDRGSYDKFIELDYAPNVLWERFVKSCNQEGVGINRKINEGVVKGFVKLASVSIHHNPFEQIGLNIVSNTVDAFLSLRNISGIGDKIASFITRDVITILDVEDKIAPEDHVLIQPIDRWIKGMASLFWPELRNRAPSWLVALKIVAKCREYGCSDARFNQGAWMYGSSEIQNTNRISEGMFSGLYV